MKLIADGDLLVFRSCAAVEREVPVGPHRILMSSVEDARGVFEERFDELSKLANTDDIVFAFSDTVNWRKSVLPTYKGNRVGTRKPLAYVDLKEHIEAHYDTICEPGLEADDLMGILASKPGHAIWTMDKDLKQCPGLHLIDDEIVEITAEAGDRFHYMQTLMGDITDGYTGCPGIGERLANDFLDAPYITTPTSRELKSGKNKGSLQEIWTKTPTDDIWAGIVSLYEKAGLSEAEALAQARVARILRDGEYDFARKKVKLWKPTR